MSDAGDAYDALRAGLQPHEQGRYFELGRAYLERETREAGWQHQVPLGGRVLDSAKLDSRGKVEQGRERKSGRVDREAVPQLRKERDALRDGTLGSSRWETVAGTPISAEAQRWIDALKREFPDRFEHRIISRAEAVLAIKEGQRIAQSRQLELISRPELQRQARQKAERDRKQRERDRAERERAQREKDAREREKNERTKTRHAARERADHLTRTYQRFRDGAERGFTHVDRAHIRADGLCDVHRRFREMSERGRHDAARHAREREAAEREARRVRDLREA
ncbi:hypothetical protein FHY52_35270, partial [Nocardia nova]|uniref:hypothetical protein n=1 Tax=Nocardia nova TaxID=37330 RepID=UPI0025AF8F7C